MDDWYGVEISACTTNARRQRLAQILGSDTMRNYLESILMEWSDAQVKERYFNALNSDNPYAFEDLYINSPDLRMELGKVVATCLDALYETGTDRNHRLSALWAPNPRDILNASFYWAAHRWTGLLIDNQDYCTFVVVSKACLELGDPDLASRR